MLMPYSLGNLPRMTTVVTGVEGKKIKTKSTFYTIKRFCIFKIFLTTGNSKTKMFLSISLKRKPS